MLNCFCLERKHRIPKCVAFEFKNVRAGAGRHLLNEVIATHLGQLLQPGAFSFEVGLVNGKPASQATKRRVMASLGLEGERDIRSAQVSRFSPLATCARNDIVLIKRRGDRFQAGKVQYHCEVDGDALSLVSMFTLHQHVGDSGYATWRVNEEGAIPVPTANILEAVIYSYWADDIVRTFLPMEFR